MCHRKREMSQENKLIFKDNSRYQIVSEISKKKEISEEQWKSIESLSNIDNLQNIISIPKREFIRKEKKDIFKRENNWLCTTNWVGILTNRSSNGELCRIELHSRFDNAKKQYFLIYLIQNIYGIHIFNNMVYSTQNTNFRVIIVIFFLNLIQEAYHQGLFKVYGDKEYNDYSFRGVLDVPRHIKVNTPFVGKTAYKTREYTYDNDILCLLRQTIEYIKENDTEIWKIYCENQLHYEFQEVMQAIEFATPSYHTNILYQNRKLCQIPITNPCYSKYEEARKLALLLLQEHGENLYQENENYTFGFLVDIAWLWEEFIAVKLLKNKGYRHLIAGEKAKGYLVYARKRQREKYWYPDFIELKDETQRRNIIDAKYKKWNFNNDDIVLSLYYWWNSVWSYISNE